MSMSQFWGGYGYHKCVCVCVCVCVRACTCLYHLCRGVVMLFFFFFFLKKVNWWHSVVLISHFERLHHWGYGILLIGNLRIPECIES